jgi:hypothetical protein
MKVQIARAHTVLPFRRDRLHGRLLARGSCCAKVHGREYHCDIFMTNQQMDNLAGWHAGNDIRHLLGTDPTAPGDLVARGGRHIACKIHQENVVPFGQSAKLEQESEAVNS